MWATSFSWGFSDVILWRRCVDFHLWVSYILWVLTVRNDVQAQVFRSYVQWRIQPQGHIETEDWLVIFAAWFSTQADDAINDNYLLSFHFHNVYSAKENKRHLVNKSLVLFSAKEELTLGLIQTEIKTFSWTMTNEMKSSNKWNWNILRNGTAVGKILPDNTQEIDNMLRTWEPVTNIWYIVVNPAGWEECRELPPPPP